MRRRSMSTMGLGLAGALLLGLAWPGTAWAAPGDASARGVVVDLAGTVGGVAVVTADAVVGAADAPAGGGTDTDTALDVAAALTGAVGVAATGTVVEVTATRGATLSTASATVAGVSLDVLGVSALTTGDVTADVSCPQTGPLTADTTLAGLTLLGTAVTLDANTPAVTASSAVTVAGLTGATLTVALTRVETVVEPDATAVAVAATLTLAGTAAGVPVTVPLGTVTIASATCERPAAAAVPTATAITPDEGPTAGGQTVTITGTGFVPGATTVTFDGVPATGVTVDPTGTSLTAVTPPGAAGPADVVVTTAGGSSAPLAYTYVAPAVAPDATGITPTSGPTTGGTTVTITGTGFTPGTTVTFDGVPATGVTVNPAGTAITAVTPPGAAGPADVVVTNPNGTDTLPGAFTYVAAPVAPDALGLTPDSGPTAGGTTVTITGTGLAGTTRVTFGGVPATIVSRSATSVVVRTPAHAAGAVDVAVTTPGGTDTLPDAFTYVAPDGGVGGDGDPDAPTISALTPDRGPTAGGQTVVITGSGFRDGGTTVTFDGVPATSVAVVDEDTLVVRTPPGAAGSAEVVVSVDGVASDPLTYTYVAGATVPAAPAADTLDPDSGPTSGGTRVTVTGSGFVPGQTSVIVCDTTLLPDDVSVAAGGRSLTFVTPECAAGQQDVVVVTPGGVAPALPFSYVEGAGSDVGGDGVGGSGVDGSGDLAETGSEIARVSGLGLLLLVAGAALAVVARRRSVLQS